MVKLRSWRRSLDSVARRSGRRFSCHTRTNSVPASRGAATHHGRDLAPDHGMLHFCSGAQTHIYSPRSTGMKPALIVFAKAPISGRVKTRLGLDPNRAAEIHRELVW